MSLRRAALVLAAAFAFSVFVRAPGAGDARAQTWRPKTRRDKPAAGEPDKDAKRKPKRRRAKPASKRKRPARDRAPRERVVDEPGEDAEDEEVLIEESGEDFGDDGEDWTGDEGDWPDDGDDAVIIEDDLDDVGPDARISDADLTTDATAGAGTGSTRLETRAMAFLSTGIDVVHDAAPDPESVSGLTPNGEDVISFRLHGRASGTGRFGRRVKVKVAGRFDADLALDSDTNFNTQRYEGRVWDTYADLYSSWLDMRAGNQFFAWGTADMLTQNDVINARDLRRGLLEHPDELRIPTLAFALTAHDGPFAAQAVYVPVAPVNRFELLEGDYALLGPHGATALERKVGAIVNALRDDPMLGLALQPILDIGDDPGHGIETGEVGANIGLRFRKIDLFGYLFWGHERNPRIELADGLLELFRTTPVSDLDPELLTMRINELAAMGVTAVEADYPRRVHVGGALATRLEPVGIKLDVGYTIDANVVLVPPGQGPLLGQPADQDVLGATLSFDYNRGDVLTFILEGGYTRVFGVAEDVAVYQLDGHELIAFATRLQWAPGAGPLQLRLLGFVEARDEPSYAVRPSLRLSGHDNLSIEVAAVIYGGPATSLGGIQDHNDEIQLTVQYGL